MGDGYQVFVAADDGTLAGTKEERETKLKERKLFEIDQYYHIIEPFTFKTAFIDISVEEGKAWRDYNRGATLDDSQNSLLNDFKSRVDKVIQEFGNRGNASFFRLSTRSPKDAVDKLPKLKNLLNEEIQKAKEKYTKEELNYNQLLVALRRAFFKAMSVKSAEEAFTLVMYSSRAISDMKRALDHLDLSPWHMKAICEYIPIEGEFRGFVFNKNLTALSQYYADCFFEELPSRKEEIAKAVQEFFATHIRDLLPFSAYIIDFVVFKDNSVMIVELNPYSVNTGPCLFDWQKDKEVLENGPFELRVNTVENKNAEGYLMPFKSLISEDIPNTNNNDNNKEKEENKNCILM